MNRLLHTPDGFRDIYPEEASARRAVTDKLTAVLSSYGYDRIVPPAMEFFDIFGNDIGTTPSQELYKFIDRDGNTLVLRPDFTPQAARAASTYFSDRKAPVRISYAGNVYVNRKSLRGQLRERTELGAELIGDDSPEADAEVLALICDLFQASGIREYQITISHAGILASLFEKAAFDEEDAGRARDLIANRNFFGLREFVEERDLSPALKKLFCLLGPEIASPADWEKTLSATDEFPEIFDRIRYIEKLTEILGLYGKTDHISADFGTITDFHYYTGLIFQGFTFGVGEPVVRGGRYDTLFEKFGNREPAIGFAFFLDQLMQALERQHIQSEAPVQKTVIYYDRSRLREALLLAGDLRRDGKRAELIEAGQCPLDALQAERQGNEIRVLKGAAS